MEVLVMSTRSNQRISLQLIVGLGFVLMLSLVFWAYNLGKGRGAATAQRDPAHNQAALAGDAVKPPTPSAPAPAPVTPATQPAAAVATLVTPTPPAGAAPASPPSPSVTLTAAPTTAPSG